MSMHPAIDTGRVAVITGGASGIGLAVAEHLFEQGMKLVLVDADSDALAAAEARFSARPDDLLTSDTDVGDEQAMQALAARVFDRFDDVAVLMNNAGVGGGGGPWTRPEGWRKVMGVNLWGVINGMQAFVPGMLERGRAGAVVNTGSKQGITNPPGDAAYNASKAAVKSATESLAHELRNQQDCAITAHLLVPGFTYTGMIARHVPDRPAAAWLPAQVADLLLERMGRGDFYVICPDNDVDFELDCLRMQWNLDDIKQNRPALSRWHPDYAEPFEAFTRGD